MTFAKWLITGENQLDSKSRALTDRIDDREMFMKGIDYSYYYEQEE